MSIKYVYEGLKHIITYLNIVCKCDMKDICVLLWNIKNYEIDL